MVSWPIGLDSPHGTKNVLSGDHEGEGGVGLGVQEAEERVMQQQREEYGRRGIHLTYYEKDTSMPHFINLDEDPFRSHRFMYLLDKVSPWKRLSGVGKHRERTGLGNLWRTD